jgi:enterochelin esterase-like enzyme
MKEIKKVVCLCLTLVFLATSCVSAPTLPPVDATAVPTMISTPATVSPSKTASACTGAGVLQKGVAEGKDGFSIPFQAYLPPCYEQQAAISYPVLFLIATDETVWFKTGGIAQIADRMIQVGDIPPFIIVATRTDFDRIATLSVDFADVLVPTIDSNFRTLTDRRYRAVAGGSGAADMASCVVFRYPERFATVGAFAGGWCLDDQDLIAAMPVEQRPRVFMDTGDRDLATVYTMPLWGKALAENGFQFVLNIGSGVHSFEYWSSNLEMFLLWWARAW